MPAITRRLDLRGHREAHREHIGEATIGCLHVADVTDVHREGCAGVRIGQRQLDRIGPGFHLVLEGGHDEIVSGRESSVQGGNTDFGLASHLIQWSLNASLGEDLSGCLKDLAAIELCVAPQMSIRTAGRGGRRLNSHEQRLTANAGGSRGLLALVMEQNFHLSDWGSGIEHCSDASTDCLDVAHGLGWAHACADGQLPDSQRGVPWSLTAR